MDAAISSGKPIVVCALEFERATLRRYGLDDICQMHCCGPGAEHLQMWAEAVGSTSQPVLLAGLAGSLNRHYPPGKAHEIGSVVDGDEKILQPTFAASQQFLRPSISSTEATLTSPQVKSLWRERAGSDLLDLESLAFARAGDRLGWKWTIVKGISDGHDDRLPEDIDQWIDEFGCTRYRRALSALLLRPTLIRTLLNLRLHSTSGLVGTAKIIGSLINAETRRRSQ